MKLIRVLMHEIMNSITPITSLSESLSEYTSTGRRSVLPEKVTVRNNNYHSSGIECYKGAGKRTDVIC